MENLNNRPGAELLSLSDDIVALTDRFVSIVLDYIYKQLMECNHERINFVSPIPVFDDDKEIITEYIDAVWYDEVGNAIIATRRNLSAGSYDVGNEPLENYSVDTILAVVDKFSKNV